MFSFLCVSWKIWLQLIIFYELNNKTGFLKISIHYPPTQDMSIHDTLTLSIWIENIMIKCLYTHNCKDIFEL
jgi:hypothetical protein